jgi:hypothetical protein
VQGAGRDSGKLEPSAKFVIYYMKSLYRGLLRNACRVRAEAVALEPSACASLSFSSRFRASSLPTYIYNNVCVYVCVRERERERERETESEGEYVCIIHTYTYVQPPNLLPEVGDVALALGSHCAAGLTPLVLKLIVRR